MDAALRRFKRQCNQAGIFVAMKDRTFYTKPTWARTEAKEERRRVIKRAVMAWCQEVVKRGLRVAPHGFARARSRV